MSKITDDVYLLKLKRAGWPNEKIAVKLGLTPMDVEVRWAGLVKMAHEKEENGHLELLQTAHVMADQFQLLGASMGVLTDALAKTMEQSELRKIIGECPSGEDLAEWLIKKTLILRPFSLPSPEEIAKELLKAGKAAQN